jgi:hypothetical protein
MQCLLTSREPPNPVYFPYSHQVSMHVHAGTGGHYNNVNLNEDFSATSSFSSSSKRQRIDDYGAKHY